MNLTIEVTWADGRVTQHQMNGLPDLPDVQLTELLSMDLAAYLDPDELPLTPEGWALTWVSVRLVGDGDSGRCGRVAGDLEVCADS